jgi:hypothetical protein
MPHLDNNSTSVVVVGCSVGLCVVVGCYMPHLVIVKQRSQFGCVTWLGYQLST